MLDKTDRLVALFPEAYAADDKNFLLRKLLEAIAAEFAAADESIKALLKSHWVDFAKGPALDGLAAIYGLARRRLANGAPEPDDSFRDRLKSIVRLFAGGGTRRAIIEAVRSAVGLPLNLASLSKLPAGMRAELESLIYLEEFSPQGLRVLNKAFQPVNNATQLILEVEVRSVERENPPAIQWKFTSGAGRMLSVELLNSGGQGFRAKDQFVVASGKTLTFSAGAESKLTAVLDFTDVSGSFTNLDGSTPAAMPDMPDEERSEWRFRAQSGLFDFSAFDLSDTFDLPHFEVEMNWLRFEPLTFDVYAPYFLRDIVNALKIFYRYDERVHDPIFVFEGLPLAQLPEVVNQTRAAGVRGSVKFYLKFLEDHPAQEVLKIHGAHVLTENAGAKERFIFSSAERLSERQDASEAFVIGGVFDVSPFDREHGFVG